MNGEIEDSKTSLTAAFVQTLREHHCDTTGALERLAGDAQTYAELTKGYLEQLEVASLQQAIRRQETRTAFELAHSMKGALGNLGLTPLYQPICRLTELLRSGSCAGAEALMEEILREHASLRAAVEAVR